MDNQSRALPMMIRVAGKEPDWSVNPADYAYSMTVIGNIRINQVFSTDSSDKLAAFVNGKCVGVTKNAYNASNDLWYTYLTIYSNTLSGDKPEFRIWDASTGKIYLGEPTTAITFNNGAIMGTPYQPVIFDAQQMLVQNIGLESGWNWVSFNLAGPSLNNVGNFLVNGSWTSADTIKNDQGFAQYGTQLGWAGSLTAISNTSLFMLNSQQAQTLSVNGMAADLSKIGIDVKGKGWNYISYLPPVNMTVKEALADYDAQTGDVLKSQTGFAMYDDHIGWVGNLTYMEPGSGYMLYRSSENQTSFHYGQLGGSLGLNQNLNQRQHLNLASLKTASRLMNTNQLRVAANFKYGENMTMLAAVDSSTKILPGDIVLAYVGGELRAKAGEFRLPGASAKGSEPVFLLNIAGNSADPVIFKLERRGRVVATSPAVFNYAANR